MSTASTPTISTVLTTYSSTLSSSPPSYSTLPAVHTSNSTLPLAALLSEPKQRDDMKLLLVVTMCGVTVCVIILSVSVTVCVYRKRQLNTKQESVPDPEPSLQPAPEIDLDNFDIDNFDSLPPWERDAHIWINQQILCIKNENYEQ